MWIKICDLKPIPKGRPRVNTKNLNVYTPKRTADYEEAVAWHYKKYDGTLHSGPLKLTVRFYFRGDKSKPHTKVPDLDNLLKALMDAINGVAWADDKQVTDIIASKHYADADGIVFNIEEIDG